MSPRRQELNDKMRAEALARITGGALEVFAEYGYHGATMRRIARAAGVSYGSAYHYFPSKARIFRHLVDFALESTIAGMRAALDAPGAAWERIGNFSAMLVKSALKGESSWYFLIMLQAMTQGAAIAGLSSHIEKRTAVYFETLAPLIREAQRSGEAADGDPVVLAAAYFAFVQGLSLFALHRRGLDRKITAEMLMSVLRSGRRK